MKKRIVVLWLAACLLLSGCGSIFEKGEALANGTSQFSVKMLIESLLELVLPNFGEESPSLPDEPSIQEPLTGFVAPITEVPTEAPTEAPTELPTQPPTEAPTPDPNTPRVVDMLNLTGEYFDGFSTDSYQYQIPKFNADTEAARLLNMKIENDLMPAVQGEQGNMEVGCSLVMYQMTYQVFHYQDISGVIVGKYYPGDNVYYRAYSYDFAADKEVTNLELLQIRGLSEDAFCQEIKQLQSENFETSAEQLGISDSDLDYYKDYLVYVQDMANKDLPMCLDENGALLVCIPFASFAGASRYYYQRTI